MSVLIYPACPTNCAGALPAVDFDQCAPVVHYGEIEKLYIARADAADFTNVELLSEWTARLAQTAGTDDSIRTLTVLGDQPVPESTEVQISGDRTVKGFKTFIVPFEVDETNDVNYELLLFLECDVQFKIWYQTADGMLYGGNTGILANVKLDNMIPRERGEAAKFMGEVKWKSKRHPLRSVSPLV